MTAAAAVISGQRETLTAFALAATTNTSVACREYVHGFSHNPELIGYTTVRPSIAAAVDREGPEQRLPASAARSAVGGNPMPGLSADDVHRLWGWVNANDNVEHTSTVSCAPLRAVDTPATKRADVATAALSEDLLKLVAWLDE